MLPAIAEDRLASAAKDISMAGVIGTALMLLECSDKGALIDLEAIPCPPSVDFQRWLTAFPSYGFLLSVSAPDLEQVLGRFAARGLAAASIGRIDDSRTLRLSMHGQTKTFWDLADEALIGCGPVRAGQGGV